MQKISIVTINLNNAEGLLRTIRSVVTQTYLEVEYLVVDGGSHDGSLEIIRNFENQIFWWVSENDHGIFHAMNKGVLKSSGDYLLFLNSGDWFVEDGILEKVFSKGQKADILYGDYIRFLGSGTSETISFKNKKIDLFYLLEYSLGHPSSFIRREMFQNEMYDEELRIVSDWKFFLKKIVIESCTLEYLDISVACFDSTGLSELPENKDLKESEQEKVLSRLFPPEVLESLLEIKELKRILPVSSLLEMSDCKGFKRLISGYVKGILCCYRFFKRVGIC